MAGITTFDLDIPQQYVNIGYQMVNEGRVQIEYLPQNELDNTCARSQGITLQPDQMFCGCTVRYSHMFRDDTYKVYISSNLGTLTQQVLDHELAHVGGWDIHHSN